MTDSEATENLLDLSAELKLGHFFLSAEHTPVTCLPTPTVRRSKCFLTPDLHVKPFQFMPPYDQLSLSRGAAAKSKPACCWALHCVIVLSGRAYEPARSQPVALALPVRASRAATVFIVPVMLVVMMVETRKQDENERQRALGSE